MVIAATFPVKGLMPDNSMQAMSIERTEVVLQVDEVWRRVNTSGAFNKPR